MEGVTNVIVNKEQQAQNLLENSGNILFENLSDPDLPFYNTNIQTLNTP